jgi:hypothetical protein
VNRVQRTGGSITGQSIWRWSDGWYPSGSRFPFTLKQKTIEKQPCSRFAEPADDHHGRPDSVAKSNLNFTINRDDIFIIMGESRRLNHMIGLFQLAWAQVLYDGVSFWDAPPADRDRYQRHLGLILQSGAP